MESRRKSRGSIDPSAAVKAAAWAWYERGSGSEGKPIREFNAIRAPHAPIPSRYKLEAMRLMAEEAAPPEKQEGSSTATSPTTTSLFDTYEMERISRELDYLIERRSKGVIIAGTKLYKGMKEKEKKKLTKGFWARHAIVCGTTRDDVLETIRVSPPAAGDRKSKR